MRCLAVFVFGVALFAPSAGAQYAYICTTNSNISVVNTFTNASTATLTAGTQPLAIAVNPAGSYAYVTTINNAVSVIKTATNTISATVTVGNDPSAIAINPSGTFVYVTNTQSNTVSVINAATNSVVATVSVGAEPSGIAVNSTGTYAYVANEYDGTVSVINLATNRVTGTVSVGSTPLGLAVNQAGTRVYVVSFLSATVSVIDTASNTVVATVGVGGINSTNNPRSVAVNPAGTFVYVAGFVGADPLGSGGTISVIDTASNALVAAVAVPTNGGGGHHPFGIAVNPSGSSVYVPVAGSNTVPIMDTATNTITAFATLGGTAEGAENSTGNIFIGGPGFISPSITSGGIVSSASYAPNAPVAPGSLVSVFGAFPISAAQQATVTPLSNVLAGLSVQFNGFQAPFTYASATQANVEVPWELAGQTQASVIATIGGQTSAAVKVSLATFAPGVFAVNAQGQGAVVDALSGQLISPINPATAGATYISIYCTGLGPVSFLRSES
jgi:YVTN family beta-propeller protein